MKYKNSMKKWRCLPALLLCVVLSVAVCVPASENAAQSEFEIEDGVLVRYTGEAADVEIPEGVTAIGEEAFSGNETVETVAVPEGVTTIGEKAFAGCTGLRAISLPDSLTSMGKYVFSKCSSLTTLTLPENLTVLANYFQESEEYYNPNVDPSSTPGPWETRFADTAIETLYVMAEDVTLEDDMVYGPGVNLWSDAFGAATIYGYAGTGAQTLAENCGAEFVTLYGEETDGQQYDTVDTYDTGDEIYCGIRADSGFLYWNSSEIRFDNEQLTMRYKRVTEGEEIEKYEAEFGGEAALYSFKLYENGVPKTMNSEAFVGLELTDNMMGYYGKVYLVAKDGSLRTVNWSYGNYIGCGSVGWHEWQTCVVNDGAPEYYVPTTYLVVAPHTFGDVNYDEAITASDALEVLQMVVGLRTCDGMMEITADADGDGTVDASDALDILRVTVGLESSPSAWSHIPQ